MLAPKHSGFIFSTLVSYMEAVWSFDFMSSHNQWPPASSFNFPLLHNLVSSWRVWSGTYTQRKALNLICGIKRRGETLQYLHLSKVTWPIQCRAAVVTHFGRGSSWFQTSSLISVFPCELQCDFLTLTAEWFLSAPDLILNCATFNLALQRVLGFIVLLFTLFTTV